MANGGVGSVMSFDIPLCFHILVRVLLAVVVVQLNRDVCVFTFRTTGGSWRAPCEVVVFEVLRYTRSARGACTVVERV